MQFKEAKNAQIVTISFAPNSRASFKRFARTLLYMHHSLTHTHTYRQELARMYVVCWLATIISLLSCHAMWECIYVCMCGVLCLCCFSEMSENSLHVLAQFFCFFGSFLFCAKSKKCYGIHFNHPTNQHLLLLMYMTTYSSFSSLSFPASASTAPSSSPFMF